MTDSHSKSWLKKTSFCIIIICCVFDFNFYAVMTDQLAEKSHLPIKSAHNTTRGFYLQMYTGEVGPRKGRGHRGQRASLAGSTVGMTACRAAAIRVHKGHETQVHAQVLSSGPNQAEQ